MSTNRWQDVDKRLANHVQSSRLHLSNDPNIEIQQLLDTSVASPFYTKIISGHKESDWRKYWLKIEGTQYSIKFLEAQDDKKPVKRYLIGDDTRLTLLATSNEMLEADEVVGHTEAIVMDCYYGEKCSQMLVMVAADQQTHDAWVGHLHRVVKMSGSVAEVNQ